MASSPDRQIGAFIQELVANPNQLESIALNLTNYLSSATNRHHFIKLVSDTFETCVSYGTNSVPIFKVLLLRLDQSAFITVDSKKFRFKEALDSCCQRAMPCSPISLYAFRRKLPLMNEAVKMGVLKWQIFKCLLNYYGHSESDEIAIRYQVEIVRNMCTLVDDGAVPRSKVDDSYWRQCVSRIKRAFDDGVVKDRTSKVELTNFLAFISQERIQWFPGGKLQQIRQSKQEDARNLLSRPNINTSFPQNPGSSSGSLVICCSSDESLPPPQMKKTIINDQPPPLKLTIPVLPLNDNETMSGIVLSVDQPLPPPIQLVIPPPPRISTPTIADGPSSLLVPVQTVETVMNSFIDSKSNDIQSLVESVKLMFCSRLTEQQLLDDVKEMLKVTFSNIRDFPTFTKCIGLFERLADFEICPGGGSNLAVTFRDLISRCAVDTRPVQTKEHINDFCPSFRLTNELYRIGVVRRDVFQVYALRMANTDCESAYLLLFELMKNVDSLIDADIAHLTEAEANFWTNNNTRLVNALKSKRRLFDISFVRDAAKFLVNLSKKGGWNRKNQQQQKVQEMPSCSDCCQQQQQQQEQKVVHVKSEPCEQPEITSTPLIKHTNSSSSLPPHAVSETLLSTSLSEEQATSNGNNSTEATVTVSDTSSNEPVPLDKPTEVFENEQQKTTKQNRVEEDPVVPQELVEKTSSNKTLVENSTAVNKEVSPQKEKVSELFVIDDSKKGDNTVTPMSISSDEGEKNNETNSSQNKPPSLSLVVVGVVEDDDNDKQTIKTAQNKPTSSFSSSSLTSQLHPVESDIRALMKTLTIANSRSVEPLIAKLKSITSLFSFSSAIELVLPRIFEQIVDEKTFKDATDLCLQLWQEDYGRGKNFHSEFEQFCLRYVSGKNTVDFERLKYVLWEKRSATSEEQQMPSSSASIDEKLQVFERLYSKRRLGCTRVVGQFFVLKNVNLRFMMTFCDALLGARSEHSFECLKQLLVDIGNHLVERVRDAGYEDWWTSYFDDLMKIGLQGESSETLKRTVREIVLLKSHWPDVDSRRLAREKLTELLSNLTPDLVIQTEETRDYNKIWDQIGEIVVKEFPDRHAQIFIDILLGKINQTLVEGANLQSPVIVLTEESAATTPAKMTDNNNETPTPSETPDFVSRKRNAEKINSLTPGKDGEPFAKR